MREDGEQARPVQAHVGIEVGHLLEHVERFVDLIEGGRFDLHPDLAHRRDAEEHGVAETLRDVEQLLGVDEALIERHRQSGRLGGVEQHPQERDLVAHPPCAGDGFVGEREPSLPVPALRQLEGQRREQPGPLGAVLGAGDFDRALEDVDALAVDGAGAARATAVVRERRANEGVVIADALGEGSGVEERLAERVRVGPSLRAPERDQEIEPRRLRAPAASSASRAVRYQRIASSGDNAAIASSPARSAHSATFWGSLPVAFHCVASTAGAVGVSPDSSVSASWRWWSDRRVALRSS